MADLLIMEPNDYANRRMTAALTGAGHVCVSVKTVQEGLRRLQMGGRMTTILNAQLPWSESSAFLHALAEKGLPVLFIGADPANAGHLRALYSSCCDVLPTPFDAGDLIRAVAQLIEFSSRTLNCGALRMDVEQHVVTMDGQVLSLTAQEFALLRALMSTPEATVSREELLRTAWGYEGIGITRTVDVHVQRLRRKLGAACIETVYKHGYRLRMA